VDLTTGLRLDRRPEHQGSLRLHWDACPQLAADAAATLVGERPDSNYSAFPPARVTLPGYAKLDLGLTGRLSRHFSLYGRVENLLDQQYEEVFGFPALGRFFSAGVTAHF